MATRTTSARAAKSRDYSAVTGEFPTQRASITRKMFPFDDAIMGNSEFGFVYIPDRNLGWMISCPHSLLCVNCLSQNYVITGSGNSLSPGRQWWGIVTREDTSVKNNLKYNNIHTRKWIWTKISSATWRPFCLDLSVLTPMHTWANALHWGDVTTSAAADTYHVSVS